MVKRILPMIKRILPMKIDIKEKHIDYDNLNILFYGPANTEEKNNLDINSYDIVFITNNMINIFFNKYININIKPKIILLSNQYFSLHNNSNEIEKYANHIFLIYVINKKSMKSLKNKKINIPVLLIKNNSKFKLMKTPLGLTRVLMLLEDKNYKSLNIIGCTFYNNTNTIYEKNYQLMTNQYRIEDLKLKHNLDSNIEYLKYFMTKKKINISIELSNILSLYEVEVKKNEGQGVEQHQQTLLPAFNVSVRPQRSPCDENKN
jgi:hypothetical protein